ncbi:outer membrane lipoprotein carrier protein LolA [Bacteroidota bacterium]
MKNYLAVLLLCVLSVNLFSQDVDVESILKELSNKIKNQNTIQTDFVLSNLDQDDKVIDSFEGEMLIKDEKFKLTFTGNEIISDGESVWQYMAEINEVTISEKEDDEGLLSNPRMIFTIYEYEFKYKFNKEITINNAIHYEIDLFPLKLDESNYSRIRLLINKTELKLSSLKYFGKDGNKFSIIIKEFNTGINLEDSIFIFNEKLYPEIEINDMR